MPTSTQPIITIMDATGTNQFNFWHLGVVRSLETTPEQVIKVWNNKGGATSVSDLLNTTITTLNVNGGDTDEQVVIDKWVQVCVDSVAVADGTGIKPFVNIGGAQTAPVAYQTATGDDLTNGVIKGTANDGTEANSQTNYSKITLKMTPPLNATAGSHSFKIRVQGYYI